MAFSLPDFNASPKRHKEFVSLDSKIIKSSSGGGLFITLAFGIKL
jgi:hypothetical protein